MRSPTTLSFAAVCLVAAVALYLPSAVLNLRVGSGITAKLVCSGVFASGREAEDVFRQDVDPIAHYIVTYTVDHEHKHVDVVSLPRWLPGGASLAARAVYTGSTYGCRLVYDDYPTVPLPAAGQGTADPQEATATTTSWPQGDAGASDGVPAELLARIDAIVQGQLARDPQTINTRAVVVVHNDRIIGEGYGTGVTSATRLQGWSMTKSFNNAVVGRLLKLGKLDPAFLDQPLGSNVPEWAAPSDPRGNITLNHLLTATSGLEFNEMYGGSNDPATMLFTLPDAAAYAAQKPLAHPIGSVWSYSSGTSNIISRLVRQAVFKGNDAEYWRFPHDEFFGKIGANSAIIETDASGTFVMSSFSYLTARDWARFGLLYLHKGNWLGEQLLDAAWVDESVQPANNSGSVYGKQFWLARNKATADGANHNWGWHKDVPEDLFRSSGYNEQHVYVIPSHNLVVVRLGLTPGGSPAWDPAGFLNAIIDALPASKQ